MLTSSMLISFIVQNWITHIDTERTIVQRMLLMPHGLWRWNWISSSNTFTNTPAFRLIIIIIIIDWHWKSTCNQRQQQTILAIYILFLISGSNSASVAILVSPSPGQRHLEHSRILLSKIYVDLLVDGNCSVWKLHRRWMMINIKSKPTWISISFFFSIKSPANLHFCLQIYVSIMGQPTKLILSQSAQSEKRTEDTRNFPLGNGQAMSHQVFNNASYNDQIESTPENSSTSRIGIFRLNFLWFTTIASGVNTKSKSDYYHPMTAIHGSSFAFSMWILVSFVYSRKRRKRKHRVLFSKLQNKQVGVVSFSSDASRRCFADDECHQRWRIIIIDAMPLCSTSSASTSICHTVAVNNNNNTSKHTSRRKCGTYSLRECIGLRRTFLSLFGTPLTLNASPKLGL